ncbi:MAG: hypothetical protein LIO79_09410 [Rikenellaceae bacterium]|nr:hypothetical protein [Rikenellaceae bacterium]
MKKSIFLFTAICCLLAGCSKDSSELNDETAVSPAEARALSTIPLNFYMQCFNLYGVGAQEWQIFNINFFGSDDYGNLVIRTVDGSTHGFNSLGITSATIYSNKAFTWGISTLDYVEIEMRLRPDLIYNDNNIFVYVEDYPDYGAYIQMNVNDKIGQVFKVKVPTPDAVDLKNIEVTIIYETLGPL